MNQQLDDLKFRSHIKGMRAHSVDASGMALHRVPHAHRPEGDETWENWPRQTMPRSRIYPRLGAIFLLAAVVLLAVVVLLATTRRGLGPGPVAPSGRKDVAAESIASTQALASISPVVTADPFVIRLRASRSCQVRVMVDGIALEWRPLQEGDEILARPRQEMLIESNDGGALSATVNGKAISLEPHLGRGAAFRLTSESLFANPVLEP